MSDTIDNHSIDQTVATYVDLKNKIKAAEDEFKERLKPHKERLKSLENEMLKYLVDNNLQNISTREHGTLYRKEHKSASVADWGLFVEFILENNQFHLLERRCNVSNVFEYMEEVGPVPGVNASTYLTAAVRKS